MRGRAVGLGPELLAQDRAEPLELDQRLTALAGQCVQPHQADVGVLVQLIELENSAEVIDRDPWSSVRLELGGLDEE